MNKRGRHLLFEYILRPLFLPIYCLVNGTYNVLFGWLDQRDSKNREFKFELEIRSTLSFLFDSQCGAVIPNVGIPFPEPFDYATITVTYRALLIRFVRGRGDLDVALARSECPDEWHDIAFVLAAINGVDELPNRRSIDGLSEAAAIIKPILEGLVEAFGFDRSGEVAWRLNEFHRAKRALTREWEFELNKMIK